MRGTVSSSWTHSPDTITLEVAIPVNSVATVVIPKDPEATELVLREGERVVWEEGKFVPGTPGVSKASEAKDGSLTLDVGSGHYSFKLEER